MLSKILNVAGGYSLNIWVSMPCFLNIWAAEDMQHWQRGSVGGICRIVFRGIFKTIVWMKRGDLVCCFESWFSKCIFGISNEVEILKEWDLRIGKDQKCGLSIWMVFEPKKLIDESRMRQRQIGRFTDWIANAVTVKGDMCKGAEVVGKHKVLNPILR